MLLDQSPKIPAFKSIQFRESRMDSRADPKHLKQQEKIRPFKGHGLSAWSLPIEPHGSLKPAMLKSG